MPRHRSNRELRRWLLIGLIGPVVALNAALVVVVATFFQHLLTMVLVAAILAFLLNYVVRVFKRLGMRHNTAVILVFLLTVALFVFLGITLVPNLVNQITQFTGRLPEWLSAGQKNLEFLDGWTRERNLNLDIGRIIANINSQIERQIESIAKTSVSIALGTVSTLIDSIIIVVLAFYMLLYGDRLWRGLLHLFPAEFAQPFNQALHLNFHKFLLSQFLLALFMTVTLTPIFLIMKVPFALLFTLFIGVCELIPLIGAALGIGIVTLLLLVQNPQMALWVGIICLVLQQVRDNGIGPKLMGDFTGLNPIWIFVVLLLGLQVGGVLGAFIAVPIAGTINSTIEAMTAEPKGELVAENLQKVP
jgi:predicted PurR-regulated permease PerM